MREIHWIYCPKRILSAIAEAGFDLKAIPSVFMGGGSAIMKRHVTPQDGLCRSVFITDVHANAAGYERIVGQYTCRAFYRMARR